LKFKFKTGNFNESAPIAWQEIDGKRIPVEVAFRIKDGTVEFSVGKYDKASTLIIDPTYQWHTFYCGDFAIGNFDIDTWYTNALAVDTTGNIYVAGWTRFSCDGPGPHGPIHPKSGGNSYSDIYVVKLSSSGTYQWHTFYGGAGTDDKAFAVAVDIQGNVYVTGVSLGSWLGDGSAAPKHLYSGLWDIFVLKLDTNGVYQWHTFYGSGSVAGNDWGQAIAVDSSGNVYVTGGTYDTWNGDGGALPVHQRDGSNLDIFVLKLDSNGLYKWHTIYGGGMLDLPGGIGIDSAGFVYVSGYSQETWQGDNNRDPLHATNVEPGNYDIFVLKLTDKGVYQWHAFYPGSPPPIYTVYRASARGLAVDCVGNVYVSGTSSQNWTGPSGQNPVHPFGASFSTVVLKLTSSGTYQWHTFYGGGAPLAGYSDSSGWGITVDNNAGLYLTGYSNNSWGSPLHAQIGGYNFFVLKLSTGGGYLWDTFYGAYNNEYSQLGWGDYGSGIAVSESGNVFVTGHSSKPWNGDGDTVPIPGSSSYSGNFVVALSDQGGQDGSVKILRGNSPYKWIQDAYNNAIDEDTIQVQAVAETETLIFASASNIFVWLKGGYDSGFTSNPGFTAIKGSLTISSGTVAAENLIIR
ncbi:MAG TPA: SBBP repeat-containing protein, partial [Dissulfurispiraceae bacterium]|nr:SBBP repeat-containing protein [Dissulfurispiraceae bacterium]